MKKNLKNAGLLLLIIFVGYQSVYFKSLKDLTVKGDGVNAVAYAGQFFQTQLLPLSDSAIGLSDLMTLLKANKEEAFTRYGHSLSIGSIQYFLVKGEGVITAVDSNTVAVKMADDAVSVRPKIATELVFGNALRDASGKIALTDFSNLSDVNNISMELNKIVRATVLPPFREKVQAGSQVRFYGAVELNKERLNLEAIEITPIQLEIVGQ